MCKSASPRMSGQTTTLTSKQSAERAARLAARQEAARAELAAIDPIMVTPEKAAALFSVSAAYLRTLDKSEPTFDATFRRGTLVLYDVNRLKTFFTPPQREHVAPVTGGVLPTHLIPDDMVPAKVRRAAAASGVAA